MSLLVTSRFINHLSLLPFLNFNQFQPLFGSQNFALTNIALQHCLGRIESNNSMQYITVAMIYTSKCHVSFENTSVVES